MRLFFLSSPSLSLLSLYAAAIMQDTDCYCVENMEDNIKMCIPDRCDEDGGEGGDGGGDGGGGGC